MPEYFLQQFRLDALLYRYYQCQDRVKVPWTSAYVIGVAVAVIVWYGNKRAARRI